MMSSTNSTMICREMGIGGGLKTGAHGDMHLCCGQRRSSASTLESVKASTHKPRNPSSAPCRHGEGTGRTCTNSGGGQCRSSQTTGLHRTATGGATHSFIPLAGCLQQAGPHRKQSSCVTSMVLQWHQRPRRRSTSRRRRPSVAAVRTRRLVAALLTGLGLRLRALTGDRVPFLVCGRQGERSQALLRLALSAAGRLPSLTALPTISMGLPGNDQHPGRRPGAQSSSKAWRMGCIPAQLSSHAPARPCNLGWAIWKTWRSLRAAERSCAAHPVLSDSLLLRWPRMAK